MPIWNSQLQCLEIEPEASGLIGDVLEAADGERIELWYGPEGSIRHYLPTLCRLQPNGDIEIGLPEYHQPVILHAHLIRKISIFGLDETTKKRLGEVAQKAQAQAHWLTFLAARLLDVSGQTQSPEFANC